MFSPTGVDSTGASVPSRESPNPRTGHLIRVLAGRGEDEQFDHDPANLQGHDTVTDTVCVGRRVGGNEECRRQQSPDHPVLERDHEHRAGNQEGEVAILGQWSGEEHRSNARLPSAATDGRETRRGSRIIRVTATMATATTAIRAIRVKAIGTWW